MIGVQFRGTIIRNKKNSGQFFRPGSFNIIFTPPPTLLYPMKFH